MRLQGNPTDAQSIDADDLSFCEEHEEFFGDVSDDDDSVGNESTRTLEAVHNDVMVRLLRLTDHLFSHYTLCLFLCHS